MVASKYTEKRKGNALGKEKKSNFHKTIAFDALSLFLEKEEMENDGTRKEANKREKKVIKEQTMRDKEKKSKQ